MTEKIHWLDQAATARANNSEIDIAYCGVADYPSGMIRITETERVTCATCIRLMKRQMKRKD